MTGNLLPFDGEAILWDNFYSEHEADKMFGQLLQTVPWKQDVMKIYGKEIDLPRLTASYGDPGIAYSYSGIYNESLSWMEPLNTIKKLTENITGEDFNTALLNLYRSGNDSMGWHSDDEAVLGKNPAIASISLGSSRTFQFRHKAQKDLKININLKNGSLLLMKGQTQHFWKHQLPKSDKNLLARINITFRKVIKVK